MAEEKRQSQELMRSEPDRFPVAFDDMERWFEDAFRHPFPLLRSTPWWLGFRFPRSEEVTMAVDIFEEGDEVIVRAELPGLKKQEIDVSITDDVLTISGEKKREEKIDRKGYYRLERSSGAFSRSVRLPGEVESEKAQASFAAGVLEVRLLTSEETKKKSRQIQVK
jgi:HSP20 family protein